MIKLVHDSGSSAPGFGKLALMRSLERQLAVLRHRPLGQEDEIEVLRKIVVVAQRRLGSNAFEEYAGAFWGFHETRPYMRARSQLATSLQSAGRIEAAIVELEAMLELNPRDNQGVRYALLPCYLSLRRLDGAARLFAEFDEAPWNTVFALVAKRRRSVSPSHCGRCGRRTQRLWPGW